MKRRYRLKNRKRFYMFMMVLTVLVTVIVFASVVNGADSHSEFEMITVKRGDTLWDLAEERSNGTDIRRYIEKVKKMNDMTDSSVYEGDTLKMPV
jgi:uncharacterized membrane protein